MSEVIRFYPKRHASKIPVVPQKIQPRTMAERMQGILTSHVKNSEFLEQRKLALFVAKRAEVNDYVRERRKRDPVFKLASLLRSRLLSALKGKGKKTISTFLLLGCSVEDLKEHLARQFKPGMSWNNHGEWEVDHIRPCASFDLSCEHQQRECFHFSNLQPLWKPDNREKKAKWIPNL